jgi:hypothetical protein
MAKGNQHVPRLSTHVELVPAPPRPWACSICDAGSQRHLDVSPWVDLAHMWSWYQHHRARLVVTLALSVTWMYLPGPTEHTCGAGTSTTDALGPFDL